MKLGIDQALRLTQFALLTLALDVEIDSAGDDRTNDNTYQTEDRGTHYGRPSLSPVSSRL